MKIIFGGVLVVFLSALITGSTYGQSATTNGAALTELSFRAELHRLVPQAITVEEGTYRLRVFSGIYVVPLEFRVHNSPSLAAATAANQVGNASTRNLNQVKKQSDLHPGQYILTVTGHPELTAVLTVTPRKGK